MFFLSSLHRPHVRRAGGEELAIEGGNSQKRNVLIPSRAIAGIANSKQNAFCGKFSKI